MTNVRTRIQRGGRRSRSPGTPAARRRGVGGGEQGGRGALGFPLRLGVMEEEERAARVWWAGVRPALGWLGLRLGQP